MCHKIHNLKGKTYFLFCFILFLHHQISTQSKLSAKKNHKDRQHQYASEKTLRKSSTIFITNIISHSRWVCYGSRCAAVGSMLLYLRCWRMCKLMVPLWATQQKMDPKRSWSPDKGSWQVHSDEQWWFELHRHLRPGVRSHWTLYSQFTVFNGEVI